MKKYQHYIDAWGEVLPTLQLLRPLNNLENLLDNAGNIIFHDFVMQTI